MNSHRLLEDREVRKIRVIWAVLGYVLGMIAGAGSMYIMEKDKDSPYTESLAQQLRECEETLDKGPDAVVDTP